MDQQKRIQQIVIGLKAAIIAIFPEDENLITPSADVPFTDESEKLITRAASAFYAMIPAEIMPGLEGMNSMSGGAAFISVGIDFWLTCSGSGTTFADRRELAEYEGIDQFAEEIRKKFAQFEHAEIWYDETNNEMNFSIYRPKF